MYNSSLKFPSLSVTTLALQVEQINSVYECVFDFERYRLCPKIEQVSSLVELDFMAIIDLGDSNIINLFKNHVKTQIFSTKYVWRCILIMAY